MRRLKDKRERKISDKGMSKTKLNMRWNGGEGEKERKSRRRRNTRRKKNTRPKEENMKRN